ncbi:MFS transporter [Exilibacterium tricleocarpae]|uniref:MFS transporter n=1 Tax=Exilibacterium tricleocarpae TaxID=2591008 RepID=A0A545TMA2_9GAMM|nr:VC0807 family protein [Exilibacterium tricleocarpae]TQV78271.1 MFS transporter [Exilibacterium tricleocarpae]
MTQATPEKNPKKNESLIANLLFNIIIPTVILMKLSGDEYLGTRWAIVVALAFPIIYGLRDYTRTQKVNFFSALGVVSVMLTGGISLLELDPKYIAIKEAAIPGLLGLATLISLKTPYPLVKTFLYNDKVLQVEKVADALKTHGTEAAFEKTLSNASVIVACAFFLSSILNYILAKVLLVSPPGTVAFNAELGKMTALSFPVIMVPAMVVMMSAMFYLFRSINKLTHLSLEDIIVQQ